MTDDHARNTSDLQGWERQARARELTVKEGELAVKEGELKLKQAEGRRSGWMNPLVVTGLAGVVAVLGNLVVSWYTSAAQYKLETFRSQTQKDLENQKSQLEQQRIQTQHDLEKQRSQTQHDLEKQRNQLEQQKIQNQNDAEKQRKATDALIELAKANSSKPERALIFLLEAGLISEKDPTVQALRASISATQESARANVDKNNSCSPTQGPFSVKNDGRKLIIRTGPGSNFTSAGEIPADGTGIEVIECRVTWCKIKYRCIDGWVFKDFIYSTAASSELLIGHSERSITSRRER